ncbi:hypothetical protein TNCV_3695931 [Trichonephila clavipes]|nr:hypothetical protein TNCV_3695931 [Trichonephila clavipes]
MHAERFFRLAVGVHTFFSVEELLMLGRVFGTRNDDNDITAAAQRRVFVTFFRRGTIPIRSRLCARGTMTTTHYRSCSAEGVQSLFFSVEAQFFVRSRLAFTRNDDNDILQHLLGGGCSSLFPSALYLMSGRVLVHAER